VLGCLPRQVEGQRPGRESQPDGELEEGEKEGTIGSTATNTAVCTNHVKTRSSFRLPKSSPIPSDNVICGTKLINGDRRNGSAGGGIGEVEWEAVGYVKYVR